MKQNLMIVTVGSMFLVLGCSTSSKNKNSASAGTSASAVSADNSIVSVSGVSADAVDTTIGDGLEAMADGSDGSSNAVALALTATAPDADGITRTVTCEEKDYSAIETVSRTFEKTVEKQTARMTMSNSISGEDTRIRTFSQEGATIACDEQTGKAQIDWLKVAAGLTMEAQIKRAMTHELSITHLKNGNANSFKRSVTSEGDRKHRWLSVTDDKSAGTVTMEKEVTSSMVNTRNVINRNGVEETIELILATKDQDPLKIQVVHDRQSWEIKTRTIHSGTMVTSRSGDGRIESTFKELKISLAGDECNLVSGQVTAVIYKEGEQNAVKTLTFKVVDGDYTLNDSVAGEVAEFVMTPCGKESVAD